MTYERNCPQCAKQITYKNKRVCERAEESGKLCGSCARKEVWNRADSSFRSDVTCAKRSKGMKEAWKRPDHGRKSEASKRSFSEKRRAMREDPTAVYNTKSFRDKVSQGVRTALSSSLTRMLASDVIARRNASIKKMWTVERRDQHRELMTRLWSVTKTPWEHEKGCCVSQFELKFKDALRENGFYHSSERSGSLRCIDRYIPDYVDHVTKRVVEFNGDYWHCNPKHEVFGDPTWYNKSIKMTSQERWEHGFHVIVIWESEASDETSVLLRVQSSGSI